MISKIHPFSFRKHGDQSCVYAERNTEEFVTIKDTYGECSVQPKSRCIYVSRLNWWKLQHFHYARHGMLHTHRPESADSTGSLIHGSTCVRTVPVTQQRGGPGTEKGPVQRGVGGPPPVARAPSPPTDPRSRLSGAGTGQHLKLMWQLVTRRQKKADQRKEVPPPPGEEGHRHGAGVDTAVTRGQTDVHTAAR